MFFLRLRPAAERLVDREQLDFRQTRYVLLGGELGMRGTVEILGDDRLRRRRVEKFDIGLRQLARPFGVDDATMSKLSAPNSCKARNASFSQAISTSPRPRWAKVMVAPRAPVSSTGA